MFRLTNCLYLLLFCTVAIPFLFLGIDWGVPSAERVNAITGPDVSVEELIPEILETKREQIEWDAFFPISSRPVLEVDNSASRPYRLALLRSLATRSDLPDEPLVYANLARMNPQRLDFNPRDHKYGGFFYYSVAAGLLAARVTGLPQLPNGHIDCYRNADLAGNLYRVGRVVCAVVGLVGVGLFFAFLLQNFGRWAAWTGGLLLVMSPVIQLYTHITKPHIFGVTAGMGVLWICRILLRAKEPEVTRLYLLAGFLCGVCAASTLPAGVAALFLVAAHVLRPHPFRWSNWKRGVWAFGAMILGYLVLTPYLFFSLNELREVFAHHGTGGYGYTVWTPAKLLSFVLTFLGSVPGWAATIVFGACFAGRAAWKRSSFQEPISIDTKFLALCFLFPAILLGGLFGAVRFALCAVLPFLALLGIGAQTLCERRWGKLAVIIALCVSLPGSLQNVSNFWGHDAKLFEVAEWIEKNIAPPTQIAFDQPAVPFNLTPYAIGDYDGLLDGELPETLPAYLIWTGYYSLEMDDLPEAYREIKRFSRRPGLWGIPSVYAPGNVEEAYPSRTVVVFSAKASDSL